MSKIIVVGSGIVGLATAHRLSTQGHSVTVLEKEADIALHQTGRNSGVIHSGVYYTPGSAKATMCREGARSMKEFAAANDVAFRVTGKLIVATNRSHLPGLQKLAERAKANGVAATSMTPEQAREIEPAVSSVGALHIEATGIVDYVGICRALVSKLTANRGEIRFNEAFVSAENRGAEIVVTTSKDSMAADYLINCAGLYSDRVAAASGISPDVRIVPFRGEYFELAPERSDLVQGLIYPVPDPRFPFLGVHLTKMIDGSVHAGPNAVLAFAREGYRWRDVNLDELVSSLAWPGLWHLGARNVVPGAKEMLRSASRALFAKSLAELVPGIRAGDLVPAPAGVRAQAINRNGTLVDDFHIQKGLRQLHVLNAPSPAATCALEIAAHIASELDLTL